MSRLRSNDGCPWDKEQTHQSLKQYLLEEAYEVLEAIESGSDADLKEELGDLLFQIIFHSQLASEKGSFDINDVVTAVSEKMINRHPHVFGDEKIKDSNEVLNRWEEIKKSEKKRDSILDGVPKNLPSVIRAKRLMERAGRVGFEWKETDDVWKKVEEEWGELMEARSKNDKAGMEEEIGDLMIALINVGRFVDIDCDEALRKSTEKFISRFKFIEKGLEKDGREIHKASLEEMESFWLKAKEEEH